MKQEFIEFLKKLMDANPDLTQDLMTENVQAYIDVLFNSQKNQSEITEKGKNILAFMQDHQEEQRMWKAKDIGEELFIGSRGASGTLRKLVSDGFCEKIGADPAVYALTDKGKEYKI